MLREDSVERAIQELDSAMQSHMNWTRRLFRHFLLGDAPAKDMTDPEGHNLCHFGLWLRESNPMLCSYDKPRCSQLRSSHIELHNAVRQLIEAKTAEEKKESMALFEESQTRLIDLMSHFKALMVEKRSFYDTLTGLPLRRFLEHTFVQFQRDGLRRHRKFYVALIDIDHFKNVNDQYGHSVGDDALVHFTHVLLSSFRDNEPLYRVGGEEFVHLMLVSEKETATEIIQRALDRLREQPLRLVDGTELSLTFTAGLTMVGENDDLRDALGRADSALYMGKRTGRDRVCCSESSGKSE